jgi:hypothetical protein
MNDIHNVTIINEGGVVHLLNGFNLANCKDIMITGTGSEQFYGFEISGHTAGDVGVDINGNHHILPLTISIFMIKHMAFGLKQEVANTCDKSLYYLTGIWMISPFITA